MKRIALFLATNLAVVLLLGIVLNIVYSVTDVQRGSLSGLLVFSAIFGFGGAFISLWISKWMALRSVGGQVIDRPHNDVEAWLLETVSRQAKAAGIGMPEVAVYRSNDMNAFATGARRDNSLVAVSTGLLNGMSKDEVEAVLAHEVSHIANGDMVTMALMQGVVNTFVMFFARIIASAVAGNREGSSIFVYYLVTFFMEMVLGFFANLLVLWYSRRREFYADAGAGALEGNHKMIAALERLKQGHDSKLQGSMMAFGIHGKSTFAEMLMSHPPLEKRIEALRN